MGVFPETERTVNWGHLLQLVKKEDLPRPAGGRNPEKEGARGLHPWGSTLV
jgi:hypothetical protein